MKSKEQIQEIIKTRNITQLIHFTKKKNEDKENKSHFLHYLVSQVLQPNEKKNGRTLFRIENDEEKPVKEQPQQKKVEDTNRQEKKEDEEDVGTNTQEEKKKDGGEETTTATDGGEKEKKEGEDDPPMYTGKVITDPDKMVKGLENAPVLKVGEKKTDNADALNQLVLENNKNKQKLKVDG